MESHHKKNFQLRYGQYNRMLSPFYILLDPPLYDKRTLPTQ